MRCITSNHSLKKNLRGIYYVTITEYLSKAKRHNTERGILEKHTISPSTLPYILEIYSLIAPDI